MRKKLSNFFTLGKRFKREFRRQMRSLIIIALGFTIAFTWRQTIFDLSQSMIQFITKVENSNSLSIYTSIFITFLCIVLICSVAYILKDNPENY
ncbi:MAG: hypothetical protein KKF68_01280 [Nanoarchaeota archaeon]|nr:hypothetical protein [Nanoarchaeota archaeon]